MDLLLHKDDDNDAGRRVPGELLAGRYVTNEHCPRCEVHPLRAVPLQCTPARDGQHVYQAAGCVDCGRHVGTLRCLVSYWDTSEDDRVLNGRARVYGGRQAEGHGDRAGNQFMDEIRGGE